MGAAGPLRCPRRLDRRLSARARRRPAHRSRLLARPARRFSTDRSLDPSRAYAVPMRSEYDASTWALSAALFLAAVFWVMYVAAEPYIRRRWPQSLISWSRLVAGAFRDPLVGAHMLMGGIHDRRLLHLVRRHLARHYPPYPGHRRIRLPLRPRRAASCSRKASSKADPSPDAKLTFASACLPRRRLVSALRHSRTLRRRRPLLPRRSGT